MKIYAIFPDEPYMNSMSVHTMENPSNELQKLGVICCSQGFFFSNYISSINDEDIVIMWVGARNEEWLTKLSHLKCRKFLRNIDSCKSDKILFKREQEIFHRTGFEAILLTYCTNYNKKFLADRGIKSIDYPHLMDFSKNYFLPIEKRPFDFFISGQMSSASYPLRTKLASLLSKHKEKYKTCFLPHPGHTKKFASHPFYGEKYVELASNCKIAVTCTGDDDSLVMKYLEFAKAGVLPMGDYPSNIPENAKEAMLKVNKDMPDEEILCLIDETLNNTKILEKKIVSYQQAMLIFDISKTSEVLKTILSKGQ